jgi:DNA repair protein RecO (recombination protein O)
MSDIIKTEAIVLNKINYRESSKIASFYTKDFGKISAIIKGARSPKSQIGLKVDIMNHLQVVIYKKDARELQLITQVELLSHFGKIKEDLNKLKYASAVIELIHSLIIENEVNQRLFRGIVKILSLFDSSDTQPGILLVQFILFLLKELGYELQLDKCSICGKEITSGNFQGKIAFNFERGIICTDCKIDFFESYVFSKELFDFLNCLTKRKDDCRVNLNDIDKALNFLEKYIKYHIPEFKGIKSIHLY